jgi:hypothetical protein
MLVHISRSPYYKGEAKLVFAEYGNGRTAIQGFDPRTGEPLFTLTKNVPEAVLFGDQVIVKGFDENAGVVEDLISQGVLGPPVRAIQLHQHYELTVHELRRRV